MHGYGALTHSNLSPHSSHLKPALNLLQVTRLFTDDSCHPDGSVNFVNSLPLGYTASHFINETGHWCMGVWGHPCGGMFSSMCAFCPHVVSIILGSLEECGCELCVAVTSDAEAS